VASVCDGDAVFCVM